jgi:miniconductance mechanosensitive channel
MTDTINTWLLNLGLPEKLSEPISWIVLAFGVILLAFVSNFIAKRILIVGMAVFVRKTKTNWDDALVRNRVFTRLSHLAPAMVIYYTAYLFPPLEAFLKRFSTVYMIMVGLAVFSAFLNAVNDIYMDFKVSRERPIKGYLQVAKIIVSVFLIIIALAALLNRPAWPFISGLGAMTAVLILVFKDTILGLVASVQLSSNDMVRIGDWIEMPKYGADGDVVDISLHTVKVQNWDKTISTIPTYALISDSFKNWRGMSESGGRRIKRALYIDMNSVKFCTAMMLDRFSKFQLISDYLKTKQNEIAEFNKEHNVDTSELINGRGLTNIGTFRAYIIAYLRNHPKIHDDMTFLVRQLAPGEYGLPLEIYVFSKDQVWANYEAIQADIFDHILSVVPLFELRIFQNPSGSDFRLLAGKTG